MALNKSKYKDVQFYTEFPHIREAGKGVVTSSTDQYGSHWVNTTRSMPAAVKEFPAYVRAYVEYPTGTFAPVQGTDGLLVGWTNSTIYFFGFYKNAPYNEQFRIHYFVYDRLEQ